MRFLAVCHRTVDEREPVIELLGCLDGLSGMKRVRRSMAVRRWDVGSRGSRALAEFSADGGRGWAGGRAWVFHAELDVRGQVQIRYVGCWLARTLGGRAARSLAAWTQFTLLTSTSPMGAEASHSSTLIIGFGCGVRVFKFGGRLLADAIADRPQQTLTSVLPRRFRRPTSGFRGREQWAVNEQQQSSKKVAGKAIS